MMLLLLLLLLRNIWKWMTHHLVKYTVSLFISSGCRLPSHLRMILTISNWLINVKIKIK